MFFQDNCPGLLLTGKYHDIYGTSPNSNMDYILDAIVYVSF